MTLSTAWRLRWARLPSRRPGTGRTVRLHRTDVRPQRTGTVRPRAAAAAVDDRALQSERARFAAGVDVELRLACRSEMAMRRELGCAARVLLRRRLYRRLGFVRLSDYARERLGISGRTLQAAAWLATRLDALPAVSRAYDRSELSWAQARALCATASAGDEEQWLEVARHHTVEELERLAKRARPRRDIPPDPEPAGGEIDGEPVLRWRFVCPARVRAVWRRAVELASRMAGQPLATWQASELIAAEGFSGRPAGASVGDRALMAAIRLARRKMREGRRTDAEVAESGTDRHAPAGSASAAAATIGTRADRADGAPVDDAHALRRPAEAHAFPAEAEACPADAFALDARLQEAMRVIRTAEPRIGRLLRVVVDHRLYRALGYAKLDDYARERLGLSMRKVWALAKVERATARSDDFARAYREGRVSWVQALTLLPVLERTNAAAWVARADTVTVRRLGDEVSWVLEARDVAGTAASLAPPPLDSRLASPVGTLVERHRASSLGPVPGEKCREVSPGCDVQIGARSLGPSTERPTEQSGPQFTDRSTRTTALDSAAGGGRRHGDHVRCSRLGRRLAARRPRRLRTAGRPAVDGARAPAPSRRAPLGERAAPSRSDFRPRRLALHGAGMQLATEPARSPHHVPLARRAQHSRQSDGGLRGAPPPRAARRNDPRVGDGAVGDRVATRGAERDAAARDLRRGPSVPVARADLGCGGLTYERRRFTGWRLIPSNDLRVAPTE